MSAPAPTVIGSAAAMRQPTCIGDAPGSAISPPPSVLKPTAMPMATCPPEAKGSLGGGLAESPRVAPKVTALGGKLPPMPSNPVAEAAPSAAHRSFAPTAVLGHRPATASTGAQPQASAPSEPAQASVLPGTQRKPVQVTLAQLEQRFPGIGADFALKTEVLALLAGITPSAMDTSAWLSFGIGAQETLATLVKARLTLMESSPTRSVTQHLKRLQKLLGGVLDAMEGGFFSRSPLKVWDEVDSEVHHLEGLLVQAGADLVSLIQRIEALTQQNLAAGRALQAHSLAGEYLMDRIDPQVGSLLLTRLSAMNSAQALVVEQVHALSLDATAVQELAALVQDGVLLKLPAMYSQVAALTAKPSDTQRFMAAESLSEIITTLQRKI